jgi:hypothetical protein
MDTGVVDEAAVLGIEAEGVLLAAPLTSLLLLPTLVPPPQAVKTAAHDIAVQTKRGRRSMGRVLP